MKAKCLIAIFSVVLLCSYKSPEEQKKYSIAELSDIFHFKYKECCVFYEQHPDDYFVLGEIEAYKDILRHIYSGRPWLIPDET